MIWHQLSPQTAPELRVERAELLAALRRLEQTDEGQVLTRLQRLARRLLAPRRPR